jgi:hypothetical protein
MKNWLFGDGELLEEGREGEEIVRQFLEKHPSVATVDDLRSDPHWQSKDVDYCANLHENGGKWYIEAKSDQHIARTQNVLFELARIQHSDDPCARLGWSVFSEASYLMIWCKPKQFLYWIDVSSFRRGMQRYVTDARGTTKVVHVNSDNTRTTINVLIPIRYMPYRQFEYVGNGWKVKH